MIVFVQHFQDQDINESDSFLGHDKNIEGTQLIQILLLTFDMIHTQMVGANSMGSTTSNPNIVQRMINDDLQKKNEEVLSHFIDLFG